MENKMVFLNSVECQRSIINIKNSKGPRIDPCSTITLLYLLLLEFW